MGERRRKYNPQYTLQYREFRDGDIEEEIREAFQVVCYRNGGGVDDNCVSFKGL